MSSMPPRSRPSPLPARRAGWTLGLVIASLAMLGARCEKNGPPPEPDPDPGPVPTEPDLPPNPTITDELPQGIDTDMQSILDEVYGGGTLLDHKKEQGDVEVVYQLDYELARAHQAADEDPLKSALQTRGYVIDQETPTESLGISAHPGAYDDVDILVGTAVGKSRLNVSITQM